MKKILIISSFILIIISVSTIGYSIVSANDIVTEKKDILLVQENKEKYLTPYGYTIDNPNIIVNPYGISPLTALIMFETDEYLPVTITIEGKDSNSTYTNTFESSNRHYIPVYGLYPDTVNSINLKCGEYNKLIEIETEPLPEELLVIENTSNESNQLTFITSNTYPYAIDNNNDIRWYLTKKYSKQINYLSNHHLLLSDESINNNLSNKLVEIDLLGKIHKQYIIDTPYLGTYIETETSLIINSTPIIEIDKQTGIIIKSKTKEKSNEVFYQTSSQYQSQLPLYTSKKDYLITTSIKHNLTTETKKSEKNIFLIGYIEPNKTYNKYNIEIIKNNDNLQITGNFSKNDKVYIILDKFLDKRVYDITDNITIINKQGLSGKYSIYISINNTIYKTDNYIKF